jgi:hypothetical protein
MTKRFYLAEYVDANAHSKTCGQRVTRFVTAAGWTKSGLRVDRWFETVAANAAEARANFATGKGSWNS